MDFKTNFPRKCFETIRTIDFVDLGVGMCYSIFSIFVDFGVCFSALFNAGLTEEIKLDRYLHQHLWYYMSEARTIVYSQFLELYKSVTIDAMAKAFGASLDFIGACRSFHSE
ncbi:hypothetical protein Droror1_Dr00010268 [Drosera rotundifolia]